MAAGEGVAPALVATLSNIGAGVASGMALNAAFPCVMPLNAPAVSAPTAPAFRDSFRLPPPSSVVPALATKPCPAATAAEPKPPSKPVAAPPVTAKSAAPITILPTVLLANFLTALPIFLNAPLREKNSGSPVAGFIDPLPPLLRSMAASCGLMCASIVSPLRPSDAMPPFAKPCGGIGAAAAGLKVRMSSGVVTPVGIGPWAVGLASRI